MEGIGINLPLLLAFVVNFIILLALLSFILYKPVLKKLDERQLIIKESIENAENIQRQLAETENSIQEQLESARKEGQKIIANAEQIGERLKTEAKEESRIEAELIMKKAQIEIQQQREKDIQELREQFVDIAILAAEKVVRETLDKDKHNRIIIDVLKDKTKSN